MSLDAKRCAELLAIRERAEVIAALEQREREHGGDALLRSAVALLRQRAPSEFALTEAVDRIVSDLSCRRGLRHEWERIDDDIVSEIRDTWKDCIRNALAAPEPPHD